MNPDYDDGVKLTEMPDGSLQIEWDKNDPRWSVFNSMSQEEFQNFIIEALEQATRNEP